MKGDIKGVKVDVAGPLLTGSLEASADSESFSSRLIGSEEEDPTPVNKAEALINWSLGLRISSLFTATESMSDSVILAALN